MIYMVAYQLPCYCIKQFTQFSLQYDCKPPTVCVKNITETAGITCYRLLPPLIVLKLVSFSSSLKMEVYLPLESLLTILYKQTPPKVSRAQTGGERDIRSRTCIIETTT